MRLPGSGASLISGVVAAITASLCCVGPLVLLMLGVSGAWIAQLTALEPVRPVFIGLTVVFLGLAFRRLYLTPAVCAPGAVCATTAERKRRRALFWLVTVFVVGLLAVPLIAPLFY
jgi:mercuric ion transport protein